MIRPQLPMYNIKYAPTELCEIAMKYSSDRCPRIGHCYTPFYYDFFKNRRESTKKVLEIGVGNNTMKRRLKTYTIGAGLRMWRDFFPNAQIFGADIVPEAIFTDDRITTYTCDERNPKDVKNLISKIGNDLDIVIDDASHHIGDQIFLFRTLMPLLNRKVIYIIEDCGRTRRMRKTFPKYNSLIPNLLPNELSAHDGLIVFTYK